MWVYTATDSVHTHIYIDHSCLPVYMDICIYAHDFMVRGPERSAHHHHLYVHFRHPLSDSHINAENIYVYIHYDMRMHMSVLLNVSCTYILT